MGKISISLNFYSEKMRIFVGTSNKKGRLMPP